MVNVTFVVSGLPPEHDVGVVLQGADVLDQHDRVSSCSMFRGTSPLAVHAPIRRWRVWGVLQASPPVRERQLSRGVLVDSVVTVTYYDLFALNFNLVPFWPAAFDDRRRRRTPMPRSRLRWT